jgi:transcriptional regulator with XRE-family HTH domain
MKQLATYLEATKIKRNAFAQSVGISAPYLTQILAGMKRPSLDLAFRIEKATNRLVPASCWVSHQEASIDAEPTAGSPSK